MMTPSTKLHKSVLLLFVLLSIVWTNAANSAEPDIPKPAPLKIITPERIAALPAQERSAWEAYLDRSRKAALAERTALSQELAALGKQTSQPAPNNRKEFELNSKVDQAWIDKVVADKLPETVMSFQTPSGGWSKAVDYSQGPRAAGMHWTSQSGQGWHYCGTLDNRATTEQIRFLALVGSATKSSECQAAALRGIEWLLAAQYPTGGWPQVYPVESGYHEAITLNDGAMQHAMELLLAVSSGEAPYDFVPEIMRKRAADSLSKGIDCIVKSQIVINGRKTVWCAQHDPISLEPLSARKKEPPSLSGSESADMVKFLMRSGPTTSEVKQSIEAAVAWFRDHDIKGMKLSKNAQGKTEVVPADATSEPIWARFYDVTTERPIFAGAQDGIIYDSFSEMAKNNKVAYDYFSNRPRDLINKEYPRWQKRLSK